MNDHDSERIAGLLETQGFVRTDDVLEADIVVFNTCAVRESADDRSYGNLSHLKLLKDRDPGLRIVVAGCLAQKDRDLIRQRVPWVDVVLGTHALASLPELIRRAKTEGPQMDVREEDGAFSSCLPTRRAALHHGWVLVAVGCDNACSFCIVPLVRGPQRSRAAADILAEVRSLVADGVVEVTLLGQNVNTYGRDANARGEGSGFAELLRAVDAVDGLRRLRFTSPHPRDFTPDVIDAMAECPSVCEHIHFPLQSGSDRVLGAMGRSYRAARYLKWLGRIREAVPGIAVSTDVIVGFPGETERDFEETLSVLREARFDSAYTFLYSPRPGTRAAVLPAQIPGEVAQERFERLVGLQEAISLQANEAQVGRRAEVLVEGPGKKGRVQGRTRTNRIVHFDQAARPGEFLDVRILRAHPHHLSGEPVGAPAGASSGERAGEQTAEQAARG